MIKHAGVPALSNLVSQRRQPPTFLYKVLMQRRSRAVDVEQNGTSRTETQHATLSFMPRLDAFIYRAAHPAELCTVKYLHGCMVDACKK